MFEEVIRLNAGNWAAMWMLGKVYQRLGEYADDLVKLVERGDPETIAMLLRRGSR